jgi:hypothetical protein
LFFSLSAVLTVGRQASNVYWILARRAPEDAAVRASALMDIFVLGMLNCWRLPEADVRAGGDELEPPDAWLSPLLGRFLGTHNPQSVFKRPPRMGFWRVLALLAHSHRTPERMYILRNLRCPPSCRPTATGPGRAQLGPRPGPTPPPAARCAR